MSAQPPRPAALAARVRSAIRSVSRWSRETPARLRARRLGSGALAIVAVVAALGGLLVGYANHALFDSDRFADRVVAALDDPAVHDEIARRITDDVVLHAQADLVAVQPIIESAASSIVGGDAFQSLARSAVADLHRSVFKHDQNTVALTLGDVGTVLRSALTTLKPDLAKEIERNTSTKVLDSKPPEWLLGLARVAQGFHDLAVLLIVLAVLCAAAALLLSLDRRGTVTLGGVSLAVGAALLVIVYQLARSILLGRISEPDLRAAAGAVWDAFLLDLRSALLVAAAAGVLVAAAARSMLRPVDVEDPVRRLWRAIVTVPQKTWQRTLRAIALVAAGVLIVAEREAVLDIAVLAGGLYVLFKGVEEPCAWSPRPTPIASPRSGARRAPAGASACARRRRSSSRLAYSRCSPRSSWPPAGRASAAGRSADATEARRSATGRSTRSPCPRPTTRCPRRVSVTICSPSRTRPSRSSSRTASAACSSTATTESPPRAAR